MSGPAGARAKCWRGPIATAAWSGRRQRSTTRRLVSCSLLAAVVAGGCSSEQIYNAAQGWRRSECYKIGDLDQRERCLKEASRPYDAYDKATKS